MQLLTVTSHDFRALREKFLSVKRYGLDFEAFTESDYKEGALEHDLLEVLGIGFAFEDGDKTYIPLRHSYGDNASIDDAMGLLSGVLNDPDLEMWAHNLKYEYMVCRTLGITPKNKLRCSMIAQWLLGKKLPAGGGLKLKAAAKEFLGHTMTTWEQVVPKRTKAEHVLPHIMGAYCADDALQCLRLGMKFVPELEKLKLMDVFTRLEMQFLPVLVHMKENGFELDMSRLIQLHKEFSVEMKGYADEFERLTGVGISKNKQIAEMMYETKKWWPCKGFKKGKSGNYSIDKNHLEALEKNLTDGAPLKALKLKKNYQKIATNNSTFTVSLVDKAAIHPDKRLRGDFQQTGTETGRLSSSKPNLQNIPSRTEAGRKIREAFIAAPGWYLCDADYSQAELVLMAHLSRDPMLLKAYLKNIDLHQQTADFATIECGFEVERDIGKVLNLGLIYEMQPVTLMNNLKCTIEVAEQLYKAFHRIYPYVGKYHDRMHAYARKHGFVRTLTGRIRLIPDINSKNFGKRAFAERAAVNTPDQGSAADIVKIAMRNLYQDWFNRGVLFDYYTGEGKAKLLSSVHDEVICELREDFVEEGMRDMKRHMETCVELRAPMLAQPGVGKNWTEAKNDGKRREKLVAKAMASDDEGVRKSLLEESMRFVA